ncbi:hypothetical protein Btru_002095 [Bulinus truncatus]|nr:hypothetical protein Btru_002095 [Bulinus truncatus]
MTIPQGENRGPQSVSERRKVTFASEGAVVNQLAPVTTVGSGQADNNNCAISVAASRDPVNEGNPTPEVQKFEGAHYTIPVVHLLKNDSKNNVHETAHVEAKVTVVTPSEPKRSPLPLLRFLKVNDNSTSGRSRKLSLNLPKSLQSPISIAQASDKLRRHSQPQKASYQRVPQEDPSPPNPDQQQIFTLQQEHPSESESLSAELRNVQRLSTHDAEVHASFNETDLESCIATTSRGSTGNKKVFFGKIRHNPQSPSKSSSSCKSLDDLSLVHHHHHSIHHGGASGNPKSISAHNSASSEDLSSSSSRRKRVLPAGDSGGNNPRRHTHDSHASPGSPSRCCLVSVSRVPMAAASSHLTLDSEYQTVRLAVLGAPGVGKSSIVRQFVMQQFLEEYIPTEQRQVFCPAVIINEHLYEVRIIDCPYIPYFPVNSLYEWTDFRGYGLRNATAYVLVYDITSEESFEYIKSLRLQILESRNCHDVPIFIVGNKHDLAEERGVPRREVRETDATGYYGLEGVLSTAKVRLWVHGDLFEHSMVRWLWDDWDSKCHTVQPITSLTYYDVIVQPITSLTYYDVIVQPITRLTCYDVIVQPITRLTCYDVIVQPITSLTCYDVIVQPITRLTCYDVIVQPITSLTYYDVIVQPITRLTCYDVIVQPITSLTCYDVIVQPITRLTCYDVIVQPIISLTYYDVIVQPITRLTCYDVIVQPITRLTCYDVIVQPITSLTCYDVIVQPITRLTCYDVIVQPITRLTCNDVIVQPITSLTYYNEPAIHLHHNVNNVTPISPGPQLQQ